MIHVSLDPEGLQRVITDLSNYGTKARECRESVKNTNDRNDSPTDLASSLDIISGSAEALEDKAKDLQARLDSAKAANESGITPMGADGTISYVIPDGLEDTADNALANNNVEIAKQARADAEELKKYYAGDETFIINEDWQSFMERLKANQSNPAYANVILSNIDPKTLRSIAAFADEIVDYSGAGAKGGITLEQRAEVSNMLSNVLATASNTWPTDKAKKYADQLTEDMDDKAAAGLNKLFSASRDVDIDGDGQNESVGLDYHDSMLSTIATRLEEWDQRTFPNETYIMQGGRFSGVVHAMTGNVDAATEWLAVNKENGEVDPQKTAGRVKSLMENGYIGETRWTDDWTLISAQQAVSSSADSPFKGASQAGIVSGVLNTIGESGKTIKLSDTARNGASISLSAYPYGVQLSADTSDPRKDEETGATLRTRDVDDNGWTKGLPTQPLLTNIALTNLTGQIGKNNTALTRLAGSQEAFNKNQQALETTQDGYQTVSTNFKKQSAVRGFVAGAIARQAEIDGADADKQVAAWAKAGSIAVGSLPLPGVGQLGGKFVQVAAQFLMNAGKTVAANGVENGITETFGGSETKEKTKNEKIRDAGISANSQTSGLSLLKSGIYSQEELKSVYANNMGGTVKEILNENGEILVGDSVTAKQGEAITQTVERLPEKGSLEDFNEDMKVAYGGAYDKAYSLTK